MSPFHLKPPHNIIIEPIKYEKIYSLNFFDKWPNNSLWLFSYFGLSQIILLLIEKLSKLWHVLAKFTYSSWYECQWHIYASTSNIKIFWRRELWLKPVSNFKWEEGNISKYACSYLVFLSLVGVRFLFCFSNFKET